MGNTQLRVVKNGGWGLNGESEPQKRAEAENPSHRLLGAWELDKVVALNKCFLR